MQCCHPGATSADNLLVTLGTKKFWESLPFGLQIGQFKDSRTVTAVYINPSLCTASISEVLRSSSKVAAFPSLVLHKILQLLTCWFVAQ